MSAETETTEQTNDEGQEVEQEARAMGWVPQDEFRGDKSKWVDAGQFVEHGRKVMPILRKNNETLIKDMASLRLQVNRLTKDLEGARTDLETYQEFHQEEMARRVNDVRAEILRQLKVAKDDNDTEAEVQLTDKLTQLSAAERETEQAVNGKDVTDKGQEQPPLEPAFIAWQQANPSFDRDPEFTFKAMAVAATMRKEGITTSGKEWFDEVDKRLKGEEPAGRGTGKVLGSRGGASNGSGGKDRGFDDLPPDAKAACDKFAERFVGPNRQWKTKAEYRKHYVEVYNRTN